MGETSIGSSSSSSKATTSYEFDVFLSFRGSDTRNTFTSHLHASLKNDGYSVYLDEESMNEGKEINEDLTRAIENSRVCMPIFSQNYANSKACLNELSHMVICEKEIIPIFYDVEPDVVDLKKDVYRNALDGHRRSGKVKLDKITKWEQALKKVASIKGHVLHNKKEADVITSIIENLRDIVKLKLQHVPKPFIDVDDKEEVIELFNSSPDEWQIIGIYGLGGIGKTTLARVIYNELHHRFDSCSFLEDVREKLERDRHTRELQQQLYKEIIGSRNDPGITDRNDGINELRRGLKNKKILVVFDDINDEEQLEKLIGDVRFARGSRIIVTTRNKEILERLKEKYEKVLYHKVEGIKDHQALELLCKFAFRTYPPPVRHESLAKQIISYTGNIPLALQLIGSRLSVTKEDVWEETLKELKTCPEGKMEKTMMISYEALNQNQKNIFLDIANYHGDLHKEYACYMWDKWNPVGSIDVLIKWSLINVMDKDEYKGLKVEYLRMHDVLKDFGRNIVRKKSEELHQPPSRLHINGNLDDLRGIEMKVKAFVEMLSISNATITREDMAGLCKLRFLELTQCTVIGNFEYLFPDLRWLSLFYVDFKPINFQQKNLVVFSDSNDDIKVDKLKVLDLHSWGREIIKIPFEKFSSLEVVTLVGFDVLTEIATSRTELKNLTQLTLQGSAWKDPIDWIGNLTSLCKLDLSYTRITELPNSIRHLKELKEFRATGSFLERVPELPLGLTHLHITSMRETMQVHWSNQFQLKNIIELELDCECHYTHNEMDDYLSFEWIKSAANLKELRLRISHSITGLEEVAELPLLKHLYVCFAEFQQLQLLPSSLVELRFYWCKFLNGNLDVSKLRDLKSFDLYVCEGIRNIQGFAELEFLEDVTICSCDSLQELSPADLSKLENEQNLTVDISCCSKLPEIPPRSYDLFSPLHKK